MKHFLKMCVLGGAIAASIAACSETSVSKGGDDDAPPGMAHAGLTHSGWSKLDATLRMSTLAAADNDAESAASMFVQSKDPQATRRIIEAAGGRVGTIAGDVLTAHVPSAAIAAIANTATVMRMEGAVPVHARLDKAAVAIRADQAHAGASPLPGPFTGKGVLVGVIDHGFDLTHGAFKKADGTTRVRAIWAQTLKSGTPPAGYTYGSECTAAQIDAKACAYQGASSLHGTHVAGIAAGAQIAGLPYIGMAPDADIVFVEAGNAAGVTGLDAVTTAVCDGAAYIFEMADQAKMAAVLNLSLGEHSGPHDGSSLADKCLDNLTGPGKILVAAAGNEGTGELNPLNDTPVALHATGTASATPLVARWLPGRTTGSDGKQYAAQALNIWTDAGVDLSIRIGFESTTGGAPTYSNAFTVDKPLAATTISDGTNALGNVAGTGEVAPSGAKHYRVTLADTNKDGLEAQRTWRLEITGNGKFDGFIDVTALGGFLVSGQPAGVTANHDMTIGWPAIAWKVLAVGSFVTRNQWTALDGQQHQQKTIIDNVPVVLGALSDFSSHGPARDNVGPLKPDIAAPGELLISALNSNAPAAEVRAGRIMKPTPDGYYLLEGTSMASPVTAGVIAMLLQRDPTLTVDDIRGILDRTAVKPDGVTDLPNTKWGRGKLDALGALTDVHFSPSGDAGADGSSSNGVTGGSSDGGCSASPAGGPFSGIGAAVFALGMILVRRRCRG